jgi:putative flippase GtrA
VRDGRWRARLADRWRLLVRELSGFGVVGAVAFLVDLGLFQVLYTRAGLDAVLAKLIATLVSMAVAYVGHRYWSFSHRAGPGVRREFMLFGLVNGGTLGLSLTMVALTRHHLQLDSALVLQLVNVASIAIGTAIRFVCYRRWVFSGTGRDPARATRAATGPVPTASVAGGPC